MSNISYTKNFLTMVRLKIDFPQILGLNENQPPSDFQSAIMQKFPHITTEKAQGFALNIAQPTSVRPTNDKIEWIFENKKRDKKVKISERSFIVEYNSYYSFNDFFDTVKFLFNKFTDIYPMNLFRLNLRYINEIEDEGNYKEWDGLINDNLITIPNTFVDNDTNILKSMHNLHIKEDDYVLKFNFGLHNNNYPLTISDKIFILDYECITDTDLEENDIFSNIEKYNKIITNWFEKSIEDGLRKKMGELNE